MARKETKELTDQLKGKVDAETLGDIEKMTEEEDAKPAAQETKVPEGIPHERGPAIVTTDIDELGMADPTHDISPWIEYYFYKCTSCGRKVMAGAGEVEHLERVVQSQTKEISAEARAIQTIPSVVEAECLCKTGQFDKHRKIPGTKDPRPIYGTMKLHHFKAKRPPIVR